MREEFSERFQANLFNSSRIDSGSLLVLEQKMSPERLSDLMKMQNVFEFVRLKKILTQNKEQDKNKP